MLSQIVFLKLSSFKCAQREGTILVQICLPGVFSGEFSLFSAYGKDFKIKSIV